MSPKAESARPRLDRAVVVDTAMALASEDGLDSVTIRRLAQTLHVTPMALYWHFRDKDALLGAVSDRLWDEVLQELDSSKLAGGEPRGDAEPTAIELRRIVTALVTILSRHPAVATLADQGVLESQSGLEVTERVLDLLGAQGLDHRAASETAYILLVGAVALVRSRPDADDDDSPEGVEAARRKCLALQSLPPDRYPNVAACAVPLTACNPESYFGRGVDMLLAGASFETPGAKGPRH